MRLSSKAAAVLGGLTLAAAASAAGQIDNSAARQGTGFDFYVMSLSWSPSYCAAEGANANRRQCNSDADHAFIAHGLWPQFITGYPEFCDTDQPDHVPYALVDTIIDIIPSAGLIGHQWRKHGSCTGLDQAAYLEAMREAWKRISVPAEFSDADEPAKTSAGKVEAAFIAANPGLDAGGIAVSCNSGRLSEVRICLTKELAFRDCPEVDARGCTASNLAVPQAP